MTETRPSILIVDDREQTRYVLRRVLAQAGYECAEASSGSQALISARQQPDLMVLDVHLPDISGFEVCHRIKNDPATAQILVLQVSASFVAAEDKARALDAGADGYLVHPIDGLVLLATVRSLLRLRTAEAQAREAAEQWQSTFDGLAEGVAVFDEQNRLVQWNGALADICGGHFQVEPGITADWLLERLAGRNGALPQRPGERHAAEVTLSARTLQLSLTRIGSGGAILVLADITDRKLAEYALRTAEKIAATGKLAHAIAHEINNPLEAVTNLLYLSQTSASLEEVREYLSAASAELARIARITKQSLAFHRETDAPAAVNLSDLLADTVDLFQRSSAARRVRLIYESQPTPAVHGYSGQLSQVFGNLLRNATDAAPPESEVKVRIRHLRRSGREGVSVTIHDRGPGIPEEVRTRMFDPFFTTKELKGSGLGLWVSRNLVVKHEGTIRFRSSTRPGFSGTTFEVFLPVRPSLQRAKAGED